VTGVNQDETGLGPRQVDGAFDDVASSEGSLGHGPCCRNLVEHANGHCIDRTKGQKTPGPSLAGVGELNPRIKDTTMKNTKATLLSMGAAIASAKLSRAISTLELDDLLRPMGLERRHAEWPAKLAFLGAGIVVGGVAALLLAPASGALTRTRLARKAEALTEAASIKARTLGDELGERVNAMHRGLGAEPTPPG
jgi:hypothetical protein